MAAAPLPLADHEYSPVSPELALVDAELAAELRERLAGPAETAPPPVVEPVVVEVEGFGSIEDLIVMAEEIDVHPSSDEPGSADSVLDLIVGYDAEVAPASEELEVAGPNVESIAEYVAPEMSPGEDETGTTSYPALPAAETRESDPTEVVLREIRERLTGRPEAKRPKLRRRFTVAAAAGALAATAVLAVDVQFGIAQLPDWLPL